MHAAGVLAQEVGIEPDRLSPAGGKPVFAAALARSGHPGAGACVGGAQIFRYHRCVNYIISEGLLLHLGTLK